MEREVRSFCIYCSSDWMSFSNDSGASNEPKRLTTFPFLEIRNLEKFHFTEVVPMNPFAASFKNLKSGSAFSPLTLIFENRGNETL